MLSTLCKSVIAVESHAVILMYHRFNESQYPSTNISKAQFDAQLDYLQQHGFRVWPLEKILRHFKSGLSLPDKVVAITIDDAYLSVYQVAFPEMQKRGLPFTVFVSTDNVDEGGSDYMNWEQLTKMVRAGITLGNHSGSHAHQVNRNLGENIQQWKNRIVADIRRATNRIKEKTGYVTEWYAYPYGEYSVPLAEIVRENNFIGFGQHSGPVGKNDDFRFLPRFPLSESFSDLTEFRDKIFSLPMPIANVSPLDPVIAGGRPELTVELTKSVKQSSLRCYVSGQEQAKIEWLTQRKFNVQARSELITRRSRYNCTVPHEENGRYYWYSHLWLRPELAEP